MANIMITDTTIMISVTTILSSVTGLKNSATIIMSRVAKIIISSVTVSMTAASLA